MEKLSIDISVINIKDDRIFKKLFDTFYPRAYGFASQLLSDDEGGADIAQETFLYIWQKVDSFPSLQSFKSYLYQMLKSRCLNRIRDTHPKANLSEVEDMADDISIEHLIIEQELKAHIIQEINELPDIKKEIMLMRLDGRSFDEISEELHLSINTVKSHKKEVYKLLRSKLSLYNKMASILLLGELCHLFFEA